MTRVGGSLCSRTDHRVVGDENPAPAESCVLCVFTWERNEAEVERFGAAGRLAMKQTPASPTTVVVATEKGIGQLLASQLASAGYDVSIVDASDELLRRLRRVPRSVRLPDAHVRKQTLSPRELEVAELVAHGLSNLAIARRLMVSRPTVATHVTHILSKLNFSSRAQIAAWTVARRHSLTSRVEGLGAGIEPFRHRRSRA
jgi:DNA-binding NarL/FixJ family response regulator